MKQFSKEVKDFASAIHRLTCRWNHTDGCGWFYGEEQRDYDYRKIEEILEDLKQTVTVEQLHSLADILYPHTKDWD